MQEEMISWGWVLRIWFGIVWRWAAAIVLFTFALALICNLAGRATGQVGLVNLPVVKDTGITIWFLLLVWALGATLRARHGRYRVALVSTEANLTAFD